MKSSCRALQSIIGLLELHSGIEECDLTGLDLGDHWGGEKIAAALFFLSEDTLYGRYWGAKVDIDFLHFETCYYQGIDLAIQKKAKFFDPGIQGQHKLKRGFEPVLNRSFHWIKNEEFKKAITNFCVEEAQHINKYYLGAKKSLPFKNE